MTFKRFTIISSIIFTLLGFSWTFFTYYQKFLDIEDIVSNIPDFSNHSKEHRINKQELENIMENLKILETSMNSLLDEYRYQNNEIRELYESLKNHKQEVESKINKALDPFNEGVL